MKMKRLLLLLLLLSHSALANCWDSAGQRYHVDPYLLFAIANVESGMNPYAVGWNHDGTRDVGLMQINSIHFAELQRAGIESKLLYFPDENHWVLKPANSVLWHDTVNAWLRQHIGQ